MPFAFVVLSSGLSNQEGRNKVRHTKLTHTVRSICFNVSYTIAFPVRRPALSFTRKALCTLCAGFGNYHTPEQIVPNRPVADRTVSRTGADFLHL